jgi:hypothetical protein
MSLKLNRLINSQWQGREETWYIENEGISRDVVENKWWQCAQTPAPVMLMKIKDL